ncbi:MAG: hypothetical protein JWL85_98 [Candidatus Saccharibacteria bacterium]|nr:hypothetical protein [Candidatus Saccharibacteria bacterium]
MSETLNQYTEQTREAFHEMLVSPEPYITPPSPAVAVERVLNQMSLADRLTVIREARANGSITPPDEYNRYGSRPPILVAAVTRQALLRSAYVDPEIVAWDEFRINEAKRD